MLGSGVGGKFTDVSSWVAGVNSRFEDVAGDDRTRANYDIVNNLNGEDCGV